MAGGLAAITALGLTACASEEPDDPFPVYTQPPGSSVPTPDPEDSAEPGRFSVSDLTTGLEVPWGIDFLPDGSALVTERDSTRVLQVAADGTSTVVGQVDDAEPRGEAGLLGVAVSPDFATDSTVFLYVTTADDNRVLRATLRDKLTIEEAILDSIPAHENHDGGRIAFGPDGFLYVATGDARDELSAQDPDSLSGKILRITADGEAAPGNPTPGSPVWSLGHRNVQGLAWDDAGRLWASEFGSQTWDELNLIEPGNNYGWPEVEGTGGGDEFVDPQLVWSTDQASPSGLAFADGHLWMAALRGNRLWRIKVTGAGKAVRPAAVIDGDYGRLRTVATTPEGDLWVTTSNRDGRGDPQDGDDRILLVEP